MSNPTVEQQIAQHESLNQSEWLKFKESWALAIAMDDTAPPFALRLMAVFQASVGNKTRVHMQKKFTRGVVHETVSSILESLELKDTDANRRKIRRAKSWLRDNGFIADYKPGVGGGGRKKRAPSYVLTMPNGGHPVSPVEGANRGHPVSPVEDTNGGHPVSANRGHPVSPSFDYSAMTVSNKTTLGSSSAHARETLMAGKARQTERSTPEVKWHQDYVRYFLKSESDDPPF